MNLTCFKNFNDSRYSTLSISICSIGSVDHLPKWSTLRFFILPSQSHLRLRIDTPGLNNVSIDACDFSSIFALLGSITSNFVPSFFNKPAFRLFTRFETIIDLYLLLEICSIAPAWISCLSTLTKIIMKTPTKIEYSRSTTHNQHARLNQNIITAHKKQNRTRCHQHHQPNRTHWSNIIKHLTKLTTT